MADQADRKMQHRNEKQYLKANSVILYGESSNTLQHARHRTDSMDSTRSDVTVGNVQDEVGIIPIETTRKCFFIEIFQFVYLLGVYGTAVTSHTLYLDKSCRLIMNYSQEICDNLSVYPNELDEVQRHGNNYSLYVTLLGLLPAAVTSIFFSNWSDKYGKKLPMIFAVSGILALDSGFLINGIYEDLPLYSILFFAIPSGLSGGYLTINTSVYSFVSEKSSVRYRTFRHAVMEVILLVSIPLGTFIGGQLYGSGYGKKFVPVFVFVVVAHIVCIVYAIFAYHEAKNIAAASFRTIVGDFFSFANITECVKTCIKRRENYGRAQIWLLITSMCVTSLGYTVPTDQILFYFCNKIFDWSTTHYSNISAITSAVTIITLSTASYFSTKRFQANDALLGLLGTLSLIAQNVCRSLANREWIFFTSAALGVIAGFTDIIVRSKISKIVSTDEMGKVYMLYSLLVCTTPVVGAVAATQIYNASLPYFPGLYFAISAVWLLYPLGVFGWIIHLESRTRSCMDT